MLCSSLWGRSIAGVRVGLGRQPMCSVTTTRHDTIFIDTTRHVFLIFELYNNYILKYLIYHFSEKPTDRLGLANMVGVYMAIGVGCMISMLVEMLQWMRNGEAIKNIMCSIFHTKKEVIKTTV